MWVYQSAELVIEFVTILAFNSRSIGQPLCSQCNANTSLEAILICKLIGCQDYNGRAVSNLIAVSLIIIDTFRLAAYGRNVNHKNFFIYIHQTQYLQGSTAESGHWEQQMLSSPSFREKASLCFAQSWIVVSYCVLPSLRSVTLRSWQFLHFSGYIPIKIVTVTTRYVALAVDSAAYV